MYHNILEDHIYEIIELYNNGYTLEKIAIKFNTYRHKIRKILLKYNIKMTKRKPTYTEKERKRRSTEFKERIFKNGGKLGGGRKPGYKQTIESRYKNMWQKITYNISLEWLKSFSDIDKLVFLNRSIPRRIYKSFTTETYKDFINRFYYDTKFNYLYKEWIQTKNKWIKPSLDHIKAKCNGGKTELNNLQFISWLENRAKVDIEQEEWNKIKANIQYYF